MAHDIEFYWTVIVHYIQVSNFENDAAAFLRRHTKENLDVIVTFVFKHMGIRGGVAEEEEFISKLYRSTTVAPKPD